ncbi:MAG: DUF3883 domain-containing protein [Nitrospina sp.]|nr:DUF3883 domain-containing protein [Nitrospina sp.]
MHCFSRRKQFYNKGCAAYSFLHTPEITITLSDVGAGYDIKSYTIDGLGSESAVLRHIEVKAVSPFDYKFFWTANELANAKIFQETYYLYLLPVFETGMFDLGGLEVIKNPYFNIYKNQDWDSTIELISCSLSVSSGLSE